MPRFTLPPFLRTLSSKHSTTADSPNNTDDAATDTDTTAATSASPSPSPDLRATHRQPRKQSSLTKLRDKLLSHDASISLHPRKTTLPSLRLHRQERPRTSATATQQDQRRNEEAGRTSPPATSAHAVAELNLPPPASDVALPDSESTPILDEASSRTTPPEPSLHLDSPPANPRVVLQEATPDALGGSPSGPEHSHNRPASGELALVASNVDFNTNRNTAQPALIRAVSPASLSRDLHLPADLHTHLRQQTLLGDSNAKIVKTLVDVPAKADRPHLPPTTASDSALPTGALYQHCTPSVPSMSAMLHRKIWVKRPSASATLVQIREDDLVDDVRDMILKKYANSLGKTFDAPDMTLRIVTRSDGTAPRTERLLGPEEEICRTIDTYYPGGQTVDEALIIDTPHKRTPRPSPRNYNSYHAMEDLRPQETGTDYFPLMPPTIIQPAMPHTGAPGHPHPLAADHPRSISVLNTGQVPPLPSPGGRRHRAEREHRPKYGRQHTSSPTILTHNGVPNPAAAAAPLAASVHLPHRVSGRPRVDSSASEAHHANGVPASAAQVPTPPAPEVTNGARTNSTPPTPSSAVPGSAHGHRSTRPRKTRKSTPEHAGKKRGGSTPQADPYGTNPALPNVSSMLDGSVPPINVLIVEDNIINLRILEGLMKRLKVRWQTAMNGQIAVDKWKTGGYHLVLMDIQMPIMNGLQATKEIRRLERVNGIGVFSSSSPGSPNDATNGDQNKNHNPGDDKLAKEDGLFKSPVIIVALTASSLQSDRHEALAAGCNDFLTKPVSFVWLERKVKEWGCMQALIDFDGWRKWKDYAAKEEEGKSEEQKKKERETEEKQKIKMEKMAKLQEKQRLRKEQEQREKETKAAKRESLEAPKEAEEDKEKATNGA
ncbi:Two-component response regulator SSK1p [Lecanosticta acicola]|uniref:Two-component response regulator SSK1p n=1 Tax=Lecanosticta acicola TaxID=111012 RepID=A0AAI9E9Z4_9PEZI|nr:Two-component response regulator SSK1p [Lecanosticta acicola]